MRTITVRGVGKASVKPDLIVINISIESKRREYSEAFKRAGEKIEALRQAIINSGFDEKDLKTTDFKVDTVEKDTKDRYGNWQSVFDGFRCSHKLKLEFDFDTEKLGKVLDNLSKCDGRPNFKINFSLKDPSVISDELLISATENAKNKAEVICKASNVELGELLSINYNWTDVNIFSNTDLTFDDYREFGECSFGSSALAEDMEPDDIEASDSASFVWEIK